MMEMRGDRGVGGRVGVDGYLLLLIALSLFAVGPLLQPGYFWGAHDARHSVYFLFEFDRSIQDGIWYPRWAPDFTFGYGYPFFNIYAPLAFYIGEAFHLLGLDFVSAVKAVFGLAFVLSGVAMYLFAGRLMGRAAGLIAGLTYIYVPYHIADVYVRGALAESLALVFLPLVLWAFYEAVESPRLTVVVAGGLSYAGLMLAHNGIALLFSPLLAIYVLFLLVNRWWGGRSGLRSLLRRVWPVATALLLGLGLSAIFWMPMATEFRYVRTDQWLAKYYDYRGHFVYFFQLFAPDWGFGLSQPGPHDEMPFQLGVVPLALSILSLAVVYQTKDRAIRRQLFFFQATTIVVILLMLSISATPWELLRLVTFAQFPWRLLTFTLLSTAFLAGSIVVYNEVSSHRERLLSLTILVVLIILSSYPYLTAHIIAPPDGPVSMASLMRFQQSAGEMTGSTAWVKEIPTWSTMADHLTRQGTPIVTKVDFGSLPRRGKLIVGPLDYGTTFEKVWFRAEEEGHHITFNTFYYPGWRAYILSDEHGEIVRELEIVPRGELGLITVEVPMGEHYLLLRFEDTPVRVVGKYITFLSVGVILLTVGRKIGRKVN